MLMEPVIMMIGPSLYLYVRSFRETITWKKAWPHLILFLVFSVLVGWEYYYFSKDYPLTHDIPGEVAKRPFIIVQVIVRTLQRLFYYYLSLVTLQRYQKSIQYYFSETSQINLRWIKWLIHGNLALIINTYIAYLLVTKYPQYFGVLMVLLTTYICAYVYLATMRGIAQHTAWQLHRSIKKSQVITALERIGVRPTHEIIPAKTFHNQRMESIVVDIRILMEEEKAFREPHLTLHDIAHRVGATPDEVYQAINEVFRKSFYDLVNGYRVEEAKRLLKDADNLRHPILAVSFEAGFNSKATFSNVFKKFTGITPAAYLNQQRRASIGVDN